MRAPRPARGGLLRRGAQRQRPRRPAGHQPLDGFWRRRGYLPRPDLSCVFSWKEVGDDRETPHSLGFWLKDPL
ncbi:hypothetical protein ACFQY5_02805 [Paeniroseomonas aquatica]|uniref:hypothetical protein n=1 Tax=Paeniroseomonas aquatica TaxID=373043 RepID=UPI003613B056